MLVGSRVPASKRRQEAAKNKALTKEDMEFIDAVYNKYDINKDGELATSELKKLLTDLNDGHAPTDEEVEEMVEHADRNSDGTVNRQEFMSVIRAWYLMEGEKEERNKPKCCSVM